MLGYLPLWGISKKEKHKEMFPLRADETDSSLTPYISYLCENDFTVNLIRSTGSALIWLPVHLVLLQPLLIWQHSIHVLCVTRQKCSYQHILDNIHTDTDKSMIGQYLPISTEWYIGWVLLQTQTKSVHPIELFLYPNVYRELMVWK